MAIRLHQTRTVLVGFTGAKAMAIFKSTRHAASADHSKTFSVTTFLIRLLPWRTGKAGDTATLVVLKFLLATLQHHYTLPGQQNEVTKQGASQRVPLHVQR